MDIVFTAGNKGEKVRSDCLVNFIPEKSGGIVIDLNSKVEVLYGDSIIELAKRMLSFYNISHCKLLIEDSGALEFVIAARIEAVLVQYTKSQKEFLLPVNKGCFYPNQKVRPRTSRLYLPGNTPSMMINAGLHRPDAIILDLEDSVSIHKKDEARILVRNVLRAVQFYGAEKMVRINQLPLGLKDLQYILAPNVHLILIPKTEKPEQIKIVEDQIDIIRKENDIPPIYLMPIIETALGIENAFHIAMSSENIVALAIGLEDYTSDLGVSRTREGRESYYGRTRLVNACKAAGIAAIDSVFSDVGDESGLKETIKESRSLGFEGMGCIHPRQIKIIHEGYMPEMSEIIKAQIIADAYMKAHEKGQGVISIGTKMIDLPVVTKALNIIDIAIKNNLISPNWRDEYVGE
jgi:citrate lyase subunit beta/citryl-CoA lyase